MSCLKLLIFTLIPLADAPPHGLGIDHDGFPEGCPSRNDPMKACKTMVESGIVLYSVGCEPAILSYKDFFMGLAFKTGGQYVPLSRAQALSQVNVFLMPFCFCFQGWLNTPYCYVSAGSFTKDKYEKFVERLQ